MDGLLKLIRVDGITNERYQDGYVQHVDELSATRVTLVQVKSSIYSESSAFPLSKVAEVVRSFDASVASLPAGVRVERFYLLMNQRLAGAWRERRSGVAKALKRALGVEEEERSPSRRRKQSTLDRIRQRQLRIFDQTAAVPELAEDQWVEDLRRFGRSLGCTEDEVDSGISQLVFGMMRTITGTTAARWIGARSLRYAFTGSTEAKRLSRKELADKARQQVRSEMGNAVQWRASPPAEPDAGLLPRPRLVRELDEYCTQSPLVFVTGEGGVGKSALLHQWLLERAAREGDEHSPLCYVGEAATAAQDDSRWMSRVLADEWCCLPSRRSESNAEAIRRLEAASTALEAARPLALLGLDGLDEQHGSDLSVLRRLLCALWGSVSRDADGLRPAPAATLIASCRRGDRDRLVEILGLDRHGMGYGGQVPPVLVVPPFDVDELLAAATHSAPGIAARFQAAAGVGPSAAQAYDQSDGLATLGTEAAAATAEPVPDWLVAELRQPVIWGAFLQLYEQDRHAAERLLADEDGARDALAARVVRWFVTKCGRRKVWMHPDRLPEALARAAAGTANLGQGYGDQDWLQSGAGDACLEQEECRALYLEALSGGLVMEETNRTWRWRHPFVHAYLCRLAEKNRWRPRQ
ncbi:MAG: hypothetical protein HYU66_14720 [Armatimonadetes bacterium]|nr:hypothetical protein [Armatimonadota bacterium]